MWSFIFSGVLSCRSRERAVGEHDSPSSGFLIRSRGGIVMGYDAVSALHLDLVDLLCLGRLPVGLSHLLFSPSSVGLMRPKH
jgi:hypothetical protein